VPIHSLPLSFADIHAAQTRIATGVIRTPCGESAALSELNGSAIWTKLEYLQRTGSFKERGARNALMLLDEDQRRRGVVAASAGNHALALTFHARALGIPATVVMPVTAPLIKQSRCRSLGARLLLHGENIAEAKGLADQLVEKEGLTYVHGFDGLAVIAGQGTIGVEIMQQVDAPDAIVVPVGGAGLIAGIGLAVKHLRPQTLVIGVEPERAASLSAAFVANRPVRIEVQPTLGDGLAVPEVGPNAWAIARETVDRVVTVSEDDLAMAIFRLAEFEKGVVEGGGAAPLAALQSGKLDFLRGKRIVLVLAGGNIDPAILARVMDFGLVQDGRLMQFVSHIRDRPGGLARLTATIARGGASVRQISHDRTFGGADVAMVRVHCTVETRDREHGSELLALLQSEGFDVVRA